MVGDPLSRFFGLDHFHERDAVPACLVPAVGTAAPGAPPAVGARPWVYNPVAHAMHALGGVPLYSWTLRLNGYLVTTRPRPAAHGHSSQATVALMLGVPPEAMDLRPTPFAVPTAVLISRPGLAIQVKVARWFSAICNRPRVATAS